MKNKYPIQVIDLRHQVDHITHIKIQFFEESKNDPVSPKIRLYVIITSHRQIEMISDGYKIIEVKVISMKILIFEVFMTKYNLKNDTLNESQLQRVYNHPIYP